MSIEQLNREAREYCDLASIDPRAAELIGRLRMAVYDLHRRWAECSKALNASAAPAAPRDERQPEILFGWLREGDTVTKETLAAIRDEVRRAIAHQPRRGEMTDQPEAGAALTLEHWKDQAERLAKMCASLIVRLGKIEKETGKRVDYPDAEDIAMILALLSGRSPAAAVAGEVDTRKPRDIVGAVDLEDGTFANPSDNLAIALASYFERHKDRPESDEIDEEKGYGKWVLAKTYAALDRIAHALLSAARRTR